MLKQGLDLPNSPYEVLNSSACVRPILNDHHEDVWRLKVRFGSKPEVTAIVG